MGKSPLLAPFPSLLGILSKLVRGLSLEQRAGGEGEHSEQGVEGVWEQQEDGNCHLHFRGLLVFTLILISE